LILALEILTKKRKKLLEERTFFKARALNLLTTSKFTQKSSRSEGDAKGFFRSASTGLQSCQECPTEH
jgi:hypothetical protein